MYDGRIEAEQQSLVHPVLPQLSEEVQSLLSFLGDSGDVEVPFEFITYVSSEKFEGVCKGNGLVGYCQWSFECHVGSPEVYGYLRCIVSLSMPVKDKSLNIIGY